jgi:hypothetical protein
MKTTYLSKRKRLHLIFVLVAATILVKPTVSRAQSSRDSLTCMEITGKLQKFKSEFAPNYKVELIKDTLVIDSAFSDGKRKFRFFLEKNTWYGIRISCPGYLPRIISICTEIPEGKRYDKLYRFHFDTDLLKESEYDMLNHDALDFPIALIAFDKAMKCFYYSEDYTSHIKQKIYSAPTASK